MMCLRSGSCRYSYLTCGRSPWSRYAPSRSAIGCRPGRATATRRNGSSLIEHGVTPAVMAVEVISDELVARGVDIAAQVSADAAREVLASVANLPAVAQLESP